VPGELERPHPPALALSAPDVADVDGDGLLTMDEVLALNLDADWWCCRRATPRAECGPAPRPPRVLGRAFFYAGARSLLR
jgi:hypothetical protein